eukprot:1470431-Rhodomonas_salina.5
MDFTLDPKAYEATAMQTLVADLHQHNQRYTMIIDPAVLTECRPTYLRSRESVWLPTATLYVVLWSGMVVPCPELTWPGVVLTKRTVTPRAESHPRLRRANTLRWMTGTLPYGPTHLLWNVRPAIWLASSCLVFDFMCTWRRKRMGVFVKNAKGDWLTGKVWPGLVHFPDFLNPGTLHYRPTRVLRRVRLRRSLVVPAPMVLGRCYALFGTELRYGATRLDMNEPSNFCDGECEGGCEGGGDEEGQCSNLESTNPAPSLLRERYLMSSTDIP